MAMTLTDGRGELYQWDTGRTMTVDDATVTQVHFQNRAYGRTIDVDVNNGAAIIPDEILQKPGELRVYAFSGSAESGFTKVERVFNVVRRNKPNDYMFTPTEQKSLEGLQKQIGDLSDLKTAAKTDIVAAINETATAGQTLGLTGATVGQTVKIKSVDVDGKPTEWEAVELPSGAYIVNLTMGDDGSITADKTFAEIKAASDDGKVVNAKFADAIVPLCSLIDSDAVFAMTNANSDGVFTGRFICTSANVWSMSQNGFDAYTLGISGASVGQTVKIKTVDASGKPTAWEATDMASGGDWEFINEISTNEWISSVTINQDSNGNPFSLKKMRIFMTLPKTTNEAGEEQTNSGYAYYAVNGMRPAWQIPSNGWNNALFLWTIEALGDYYAVTCFKDGRNGAELWHSDIFKSEGAFSTITKFEWRMFNGAMGWSSTNFKVYGVKA